MVEREVELSQSPIVLGIDLGTTYSACGVWEAGEVTLIKNAHGELLTPSAVGLDDDQTLLVGKAAKQRLITHPDKTVAFFKRAMGTAHKTIIGNNKKFSAVELSAAVLRSLKDDAERYLQQPVEHAVISVPAYFNECQRQATRDAGQIAGLTVNRLINEPTAAAIAHGLNEREEQQIIVLDLGGGTFDVSILEYFDGVLEVHASAGDSALGGEDFNSAIIKRFLDIHGLMPDSIDDVARQRLYASVETAKRRMGARGNAEIQLEHAEKRWTSVLDEDFMQEAVAQLLLRLRGPIERALSDAGLSPRDIDRVVLVGGSTRLGVVRSLVASLFRQIPQADADPDLTVARGAAIQAGLASRDQALDDIVLTDVCPFSLGVAVQSPEAPNSREMAFSPILERNCTLPASRMERFETIEDGQPYIDAAIYQGESRWVSKNLYLGHLRVRVPKAPAGQETLSVRFSYDVNGLLEVDVTVDSMDLTVTKTFENRPGSLSEAERKKSAARFEKIKVLPWDQQPIRALTARADRIYRQLLGEERRMLGEAMSRFEAILVRQNAEEIRRESIVFSDLLDQLDKDIWS